MNSFSFKKLKIFKSADTTTVKKKANATLNKKEEKPKFWKKLIENPFIFLFIFVIILSYLIAYLPSKSLPQPEAGEIASNDIIAPDDLTIEDRETTEKRKRDAEGVILPVYEYEQNVFLNTEEKIREFFDSGREWIEIPVTADRIEEFKQASLDKFALEISNSDLRDLIRVKFATNIEESLINLIGTISNQNIILTKNLFIHGEQERGLTLLRGPEQEFLVKVDEIIDIKESKQQLVEEINKLDLPRNERSLLAIFSHLFISPNITYNVIETEARKEEAREGVETVFYNIKRGKVIVRKGDEVSQDALKEIQLINENLRAMPSWLTNFSGTFFLFGLLFLTLWYYLKSLLKFRLALKNFIMMGITLITSFLFYKLSIFLADTFSQSSNFSLLKYAESYNFAFPFQFGVILFAFLTQSTTAIIFAVINSVLVGYLFKANFDLMMFCLLGGFAAIYGIKYYGKQKRTSTFRAGLFLISPINVFVIITLHLIKERIGPVDLFVSELVMGLLGGVISSAFAFLFLPVFENLFGFLTQTKLLELSNSDLPIFRQMAIEAPGSYHHSLVVASLAEKAAEEIKLDSQLTKTGGLYHDIGKTKRPEYFIENRTRESDRHDELKPSMSTLVIINHVKEGVEMAKKLKLPKKIRDIIEQHHGNSLVRFFFQKAKEKYDPEMQTIGEESYRYMGPIPKTKEAALILLADSVEAASRSLKSHTKATLKKVITEIFNSYIQDGQLDDCDFSLKELRTVGTSFLSTIYPIYHPRVEYPGFEFEVKKKKKSGKPEKPNDRNLKPTE
ncbi:MAG: HDIG domain-containing protein [Candidatus Aminicenantes bacterium]|nr:MAG: HDIG domain-containing protein [Candidatus Aminicenantes bacterium]